jgi:hypothetical protein
MQNRPVDGRSALARIRGISAKPQVDMRQQMHDLPGNDYTLTT